MWATFTLIEANWQEKRWDLGDFRDQLPSCIRRGAYMGKAGRKTARKLSIITSERLGGEKHEAIQGPASRNTKRSTTPQERTQPSEHQPRNA